MESSYQWIESQASLEAVVRRIQADRMVAVDLEADSMYHYHEKICLLQLAAGAHIYLVDPLAECDLSIIAPLFKDNRIRKVFHGADYDIRSLYRDFQIEVQNLFDTQVAGQFLGLDATGLEAVVQQQFGVTLNKRYQRIDWSKRPLSDDSLQYAAEDVRYLIPLAERLTDALKRKGRLSWVAEECARLSEVRPSQQHAQPLFLNFKGAGTLPPGNLAILEAVLQYRDETARAKNRPLYKVLRNEIVLKLATTPPSDMAHLKKTRFLSTKQLAMFGDGLVAAIQSALALPRDLLPVYPRKKPPEVDPEVPSRINALKSWRTKMTKKYNLPAGILINKALLTAIAVNHPRSFADLKKIDGIRDWQVKTFGEDIIEIMRKRA